MISRKERIAVVILSIALVVFGILFYIVGRETYLLKKGYNTAMQGYQEINRSYPFMPEEDQKLSAEQCASFFQIQQQLRAQTKLRTQIALDAYGGEEKCRLWIVIAPTHQKALRDMQMSFAEYQWITHRILATLLVAADRGYEEAYNVVTSFHSHIRNLRYHQSYAERIVNSIEKRLRDQSSSIAASEFEITLKPLKEHPIQPEVMHFYFIVLGQDLHLMR